MAENIEKKSASLIIALYGIILIASILLPRTLSNYNAFTYLASCIVLFLYRPKVLVYIYSIFFSLLIGLFSIYNNCGWLYILIDAFIIFYLLSSVCLVKYLYISEKLQKVSKRVLILLILISIINIYNPNAYDDIGGDIRYIGIFVWGNTSASMFVILSILYWKLCSPAMSQNRKRLLSFVLMVFLIMYYLASQTRTLLFALPYWLYQFYLLYNKKVVILSYVIVLSMVGTIFAYLQENARMEEDGSYITRTELYLAQISGIVDNYVIIPHGSNGANELINKVTGNTGFSTHNDFLRYLYDWGGVFLILLFLIVRIIKQSRRFNLELLLIFLAYSGFALHNLLFLPYVWIPLILVLIVS